MFPTYASAYALKQVVACRSGLDSLHWWCFLTLLSFANQGGTDQSNRSWMRFVAQTNLPCPIHRRLVLIVLLVVHHVMMRDFGPWMRMASFVPSNHECSCVSCAPSNQDSPFLHGTSHACCGSFPSLVFPSCRVSKRRGGMRRRSPRPTHVTHTRPMRFGQISLVPDLVSPFPTRTPPAAARNAGLACVLHGQRNVLVRVTPLWCELGTKGRGGDENRGHEPNGKSA